MSPQYAHHVTLESLSAEWERVQDSLPDNLALRMRRALSWLKRAEKETDDDDAAFIFYWIAFNAAYAKDRPRDLEMTERSRFADFFDIVLSLDTDRTIYDAIWDRFSQSIRVLLDNKFVYQPFWNHQADSATTTGSTRSRVEGGQSTRLSLNSTPRSSSTRCSTGYTSCASS